MRYLTLEEILILHFRVIKDYGGVHGVRDENRVRSVVDAPRQEVFGEEQYADVFDKAAVYLRNIIGDHPFNDGNKRTGVTVCGIFLRRNEVQLNAAPTDLEDFAVTIATNRLDVPAIAAWLKAHTRTA